MTAETIFRLQKLVRRVPVADHVYEFTSNLIRSTRPNEEGASAYTKSMISWGAGPRASIFLLLAAKARAILLGRFHATEDDVRQMAHSILRHRIMPTFNAEAEGLTTDDIITKLMETPPPLPYCCIQPEKHVFQKRLKPLFAKFPSPNHHASSRFHAVLRHCR